VIGLISAQPFVPTINANHNVIQLQTHVSIKLRNKKYPDVKDGCQQTNRPGKYALPDGEEDINNT
jgi:hypothetical protein